MVVDKLHSYKCERCGIEKFAKYKSHIKRFCSHKCANYGKVKGKKVQIKCQYCNETFEILESAKRSREKQGNLVKYCSRKCSGFANTVVDKINCACCLVEFKPSRSSAKYCSRECANKHMLITGVRKRNGYWYENGYKVLYVGDGKGVKEHIKVMEDFIGRKLRYNEVVHHKDENKLNNDLENLQLMTRGEHSKLHRELEISRGKDLFK